MVASELYILYGFLAFISLLLVTLIGIQLRQSRDIGELKSMIPRIERLEEQMGTVREQLAEVRGLVLAMHERMDFIMRHHHDNAGRVVITPEEIAAD
jgi:hypothetical protein